MTETPTPAPGAAGRPLNAKHQRLKKHLIALLEERGRLLAPPEEWIVHAFLSSEGHLRLDDLLDSVRRSFPGTSMAEVKAMMRLLCEVGVAHSFSADDEPVYEHQHLDEHHDHLVCVKCGAIQEFLDSALEERQVAAASQAGFRPFYHRLTIHGLCGRCLDAAPAFRPLSAVAPGERVIVERIGAGSALAERLRSLGIARGSELEVIANHGPIQILVHGSRLALGRGMAAHILVNSASRTDWQSASR